MPTLDAQALLDCWERGRLRHTLDRGLLMYSAAAPEAQADALADRTIGERNAALLELRRALFGDALQSCLVCPACGERLEFSLSADALLERSPAQATHVLVDGVRVRMPTTRDLASVALEPDDESAARRLRDRLVEGEHADQPVSIGRLTRALDEADPRLAVGVDVACPACAHAWSAPFDIVGFLWDEIDLRARRLLDEVHVLASRYGWTESEILRLTDARRTAYVERALA
jgi:hypothetical protein